MPHHPGDGGELEEGGDVGHVTVEDVLFFVLNEGADCAVADAFRFCGGELVERFRRREIWELTSGGAGGKEDIDWVVGVELQKL